MPVILTSPAFDKQVGDTYSGPEEAWLLAQGYAYREGYDGPGVASTGPVDVPPVKDPRLAVNREGTDVDVDDGSPEGYDFKQRAKPSHQQSEVDELGYQVRTAGDEGDPILPDSEDKGSVNASDEAPDVNEQIADQFAVRSYDAEGNPAEAVEALPAQESKVYGEDRIEEGSKVHVAQNWSGSQAAVEPDEAGDDEDAPEAAESGTQA